VVQQRRVIRRVHPADAHKACMFRDVSSEASDSQREHGAPRSESTGQKVAGGFTSLCSLQGGEMRRVSASEQAQHLP
jgi:hypothetical protein